MKKKINKKLTSFIDRSTSPFHAVACMKKNLLENGFTGLNEGQRWSITPGGRYVVVRNGALAAFTCGAETELADGFRIIGSHTDSPSLQIKPNPRQDSSSYLLHGVEKYGGPILSTWLDRELSLAGRVIVCLDDNSLTATLVDFREPLVYIPNLAIHLNREVNNGQKINVQNDLSPIIGQSINNQLPDLKKIILKHIEKRVLKRDIRSIAAFDLFCYDIAKPSLFGVNKEFIAAPRLDNLLSCFIGMESILQAGEETNSLFICTNHEEIGSTSESGAHGSLLKDILSRLFLNPQDQLISIHNSFLLSLDNAHAGHPNFKDKNDPDHDVLLNGGPVLKLNANQRYSSTAPTTAVIRQLASEASVSCQDFVMRSDVPCGSTIGPITSSQIGIASADVGAPTWAMHSIREVTGSSDPESLFRLTAHFLNRKTLPKIL